MTDTRRIRELLLERVAEVARHLFPRGHRDGNHWRVGSIDGEAGKSFDICIEGAKAGWWGDFADSKKHSRNPLDLWMQARGIDFKTALHDAAQWLGVELSQRAEFKKGTFPTLAKAVAWTAKKLKMRETRRDIYHDKDGREHFVVVRFDSEKWKEYRPFHKDESGGWVMGDPPGQLPLFRLPKLLAPDLNSSEPVFVVEGEKCVCRLEELGLLVTTSAHGAQAERKSDWTPLAGQLVVSLPDNDRTGQAYASTVGQILLQLSPKATIKVIQLSGLPRKGDIVDWLEARRSHTADQIKAELFELIGNAEVLREERTAEASPKREKLKRESAASQLVAFVVDKGHGRRDAGGRRQFGPFSLFHDPKDRAFVRYQAETHVEIWPIESSRFKKILARLYYKNTGKIINRNSLADAVTTLAGLALHDNPEEPVYLRVAPYGNDILIDLCDEKWRAVQVTAQGWQLLETSPVAFVRTGSMQPLPEPRPAGGAIEPLWTLLNVTKRQRPLVAGVILNGFHPFGPYFVANYVGEQGTAKSCGATIHRQVIDPNENPLRSPPKEERDLLVQAANNWCVALDNLSHLPWWLSDGLCRIATGGGHSARTLYTDLEEISIKVKRPVILNGIEDVAQRPDLADRVVQIELEEIKDGHRIEERELWERFNQEWPRIFTAILDALVCALANRDKITFNLPRMADAAIWAAAGETVLGFKAGTFINAYRQNLAESARSAVEANPVGVAIEELLGESGQWEGEPAELLEALCLLVSEKIRNQKNWPQNVRALGHCLRRIAPALRHAGIGLERPREAKRRIIHLWKVRSDPEKTS